MDQPDHVVDHRRGTVSDLEVDQRPTVVFPMQRVKLCNKMAEHGLVDDPIDETVAVVYGVSLLKVPDLAVVLLDIDVVFQWQGMPPIILMFTNANNLTLDQE